MPLAAYTCDVSGLITGANAEAIALWGKAPTPKSATERLFGPVRHILPSSPGAIQVEESPLFAGLRGQAVPAHEVVLQCLCGARRPVLASAKPILDRQQQVQGLLVVLTDLTNAAANAAWWDNEHRLQEVVQSAMDAIISIDAEQRIVLFNAAAEQMFGWTAGEMFGQTLDRLLPAGARAHHQHAVEAYGRSRATTRAMGSLGTIFGLRRSGVKFPIEASISHTVIKGAKLYTVILRDVTERLSAEQNLRESEERFRQVTENIDEVFWLFDVDADQAIYVSPAVEKVWGFRADDFYSDPKRWLRAVHPEDLASVKEQVERLVRGEPCNLDYRVQHPNGKQRWIRHRGFPVFDPKGRLYRIAGVARDVTNERTIEERMRLAQKMEAIGQLAAGIAHDFNNLLTVIQMHGSILNQRRNPAPDESLKAMLDAAARAAILTRQLLTFSRRQVSTLAPLDLAELVGTMLQLLRRVLGEHIDLETRFQPHLPAVSADPGMMEQVVMNLAVNARDAMPQGGKLRVELDALHAPAELVAHRPGIQPGLFVRLSVIDSGCGIAPHLLSRIFEPFFTTKPDGIGTGLGLSTVFGIAQQHGGWVDVISTVNAGSSFFVFLPASAAPAPAKSPSQGQARATSQRSGRILLVEDDLAVRAVARRILTGYGYDVVDAATAHEAIVAFRATPTPFDLLLTDLIMPGGLTGEELARMLVAQQPTLRVIYVSGYSNAIVTQRLRVQPGENFLAKPFEAEALGEIVQRTLERPA